jgi:hypothetical protein
MKKERTQTQVIQLKQNKIPLSIRVGRVLLIIGAILFLANSVNSFIYWWARFAFHWIKLPEEFAEIQELFPDLAFWGDPIDIINVISDAISPIVYVLKFLAGLGAIAYVRDKGHFIDWVSWAAIIGLLICVVDLAANIRTLVVSNFNWGQFGLSFFSMQFDIIIYSIGWFLAKNWLD